MNGTVFETFRFNPQYVTALSQAATIRRFNQLQQFRRLLLLNATAFAENLCGKPECDRPRLKAKRHIQLLVALCRRTSMSFGVM